MKEIIQQIEVLAKKWQRRYERNLKRKDNKPETFDNFMLGKSSGAMQTCYTILDILKTIPMECEINKVKIKFAGVNSTGNNCYITEGGNYICNINTDFYILHQYPALGIEGIEGEVGSKLRKEYLQIVEDF